MIIHHCTFIEIHGQSIYNELYEIFIHFRFRHVILIGKFAFAHSQAYQSSNPQTTNNHETPYEFKLGSSQMRRVNKL